METRVEEPRYEIDIFWSDEDEAFVADVPDLPYCSAWGETYEDALREARVAISGHLKIAEKYGDLIPEPKHRREVREAGQQEVVGVPWQQDTSRPAGEPTGFVREDFQTLADRTVALQESTLMLTRNFFQDWIEQIQNQTQRQREAVETLSQEATNAYSEFLNSALSFYQETLSAATQVAQQNVQRATQTAQQDVRAAGQATQQDVQAANQAGQEAGQEAADQSTPQGARRARRGSRSFS